jgi:hypothetical protein
MAHSKIQKPKTPLGRTSGLNVTKGVSVFEPLSMPPQTIDVMMWITNPVAITDAKLGGAPTKSLAADPEAKAKLKHASPRVQPQKLPWLRQKPKKPPSQSSDGARARGFAAF